MTRPPTHPPTRPTTHGVDIPAPTREVFVAAFLPTESQGGVSGFDWFYQEHEACQKHTQNVQDLNTSGDHGEVALFRYFTDDNLLDSGSVTDEINACDLAELIDDPTTCLAYHVVPAPRL